jgi:hypothetical protein
MRPLENGTHRFGESGRTAMKKSLCGVALISMLVCLAAAAGEPVDQQVIASIKMEGFQNSQLMDTAFHLTEVYGPRVSGTPSLKAAAEWSRDRLAEWGLENAQLESWDLAFRGWNLQSYSAELLEPRYLRLAAVPVARTPGTDGVIEGEPILVKVEKEGDFEEHRGNLRGAIVLNDVVQGLDAEAAAAARRLGDEKLRQLVGATVPGKPADYWEEWEKWYEELEELGKVIRFFQQEGVAALLIPSSRDTGVVRVSYSGIEKIDDNAPTFVVARESFNMLARLVDRGFEPIVRVGSRVEIIEDVKGYNVIAEIPGSDPMLRDELVIIGGHLDAWHAGAGATDNAAGCAVAMEAMRILTAIGATPRRTIRVALWDGEELDYSGSVHHVVEHFADLESMELKPAHARLSAYYNYDSGTGRIRGIHLQGNEWVRPIFEAYLEPFQYLGAESVTTENTTGTDHMVFDAVGLPAFTFIQDPMDYMKLTHHTDQDVYDRLVEEDLMQSAVIMASFAYHTAMRDELLPRKTLPPPRESEDDMSAAER